MKWFRSVLLGWMVFMTSLVAEAVDRKQKVKEFFLDLDSNSMDLVDEFYANDVEFIDPAGRIQGRELLRKYYEMMYENVKEIHFDFGQLDEKGNRLFMEWKMTVASKVLKKKGVIEVDGLSVLDFDPETNQVVYHRDYFDLGAMIYEHVPLLGWVVKKVKQRLEVEGAEH